MYPARALCPKGLHAESAGAVTGRHSGVGEDFLARQPFFFFAKRAFPGSEKLHSRSESTVSPRATNRPMTKSGVLQQKTDFLAQILIFKKKDPLLNGHHVLAMTNQSCAKKIVPFSQINISILAEFGCFFGKNGFSAHFLLFGKT